MTLDESKAPADILRLIANNLTEMVLAYNMDRKLVFVNTAVETLTGYSVGEIEKANFICWIHPEDQVRMLALWDSLFHGKAFYEEEYRLVTKDGRIKWVSSSWMPIVDDSGRQVGVQGREFDKSRQKLAQTALRHSEKQLRADEERYRDLFENSPFPMWEEDFSEVRRYLDSLLAAGVSDIRSHLAVAPEAVTECLRRVRILDVNRAACEFYGSARKEDLLGELIPIFDEPAFEIFRDEIATLAESGTSFRAEFQVRTLNEEERLVDMIVSIAEGARQDWSRVIVSFFDVTDRKRLEEEFVQAQKMESLGRLAGGIAHDFNNLLTVINGYSDWVLHSMEPAHPFRVPLEQIRGAGERCAELTQQLLAFGRKQIVRPRPLDLNQVVRESHAMLVRVLGDDVRISTRLAEDLPVVEADRSQMQQVLMNLAMNGREAMPTGGVLTIETRRVADPPQALLEVRDTGHGMDERTRRHLFEPFFTTKKGSKNTGLGLAIVFGIVKHAGGRMEVESRPGEGAALRMYLPAASVAAVSERPESVSKRHHDRSGLAMVVDDREEVRTLVRGMIEELGYEVTAAGSGEEALDKARQCAGTLGLLVTDVVMPGMVGPELAKQIQRICPGIKVVFMSGYSDHALSGSGKLDRSILYLQKPFTLDQLAAVLRQAEES